MNVLVCTFLFGELRDIYFERDELDIIDVFEMKFMACSVGFFGLPRGCI